MADSASQGSDTKDSGAPRIRRRNRMITSCLECRRRKLKCDKLHPCTNCSKFSRDCMFLAPALDSVSQKKLNELKDKMGSLEKVLENDIARRGSSGRRTTSPGERSTSGDLPGEDSGSDREIVVPEDERPLECTTFAVPDAAYEDSVTEDLLDIGIWVGRMRLTEKFGGTFRPRFAEEIAFAMNEPINRNMNDPTARRLSDHDDFLAPGPTFIAPGSGFVFGDVGPRRNLIDFLPSKSAADTLLQTYYRKVHFVARVVHWPSFQLQYESFWNNILSGYEPQPSLQAIVFAVLFSAIASMEDDDVYSLFGSGKSSILTSFQTATEVALGKANYLRTSKVETLQALVIYLIPMVRDEISRAHSVLVGSALRLAECMGLHRDPQVFGMSPIGTHVRRILWFQLCYLDFRTSESQAPRPYVKRDDYDTRFPLDINDVDLMVPEPKETTGVWTDMTLTRLRFECTEILRIVTADTERLRRKKISIAHALGKIESFRQAMDAKYLPILQANVPMHAYAKHFLNAAMSRMHVTILHRYHHSVHVQIPDRLREILVTSAVAAMEHFIQLQQRPEFSDWRWYSSSMSTWNPAMLLLIEIFINPLRREADRIWAILDYTYQPDAHLPRDQKVRQILGTIRDRAAFYRDMRQIREPVNMPNRQLASRLKHPAPLPLGPDTLLFKKEDEELSVPHANGNGGNSGTSSRKQSLTSNQTNASQQQPTDAESWTFSNSSTLFVTPQLEPNLSTAPSSRHPSVSPLPPAPAVLAPRNSVTTGASLLPGLEYGSQSPGSSSTNTDAWPPPINDHHGWNMGSSPSKPQQQAPPPPTLAPLPPQADASIGQRASSMQPSMVPVANAYSTQGFGAGQLPFITNGHAGVEAMLQPPNSGYLHDDPMSLDIDWGDWDKIFPTDVHHHNASHPTVAPR